jgi:RNA polymerase sigma factor (sigma-70 family)
VSRHNERTAQTPAGGAQDERRRLLEETIEREQQELLSDIGFHVWHFGVATDREGVTALAKEVLQDTVVTALGIADKYDQSRSARLWLRNVAVVVIMRKIREQGRERHRLTLVADSEPVRRAAGDKNAREMSEAEMFDMLAPSPEGTASSQSPGAEELLALVEGDDQEILRLHYLEGLDGEELAAKFGVSKAVVYQRLSRARIKVRRAYLGGGS